MALPSAPITATASNSLRYAIDSGLMRSLRDLAPRFEHSIFLSATPHNGHSNSFTALLELLDPARFTRGVPFDQGDLDAVLVRRLKDDLRRYRQQRERRRLAAGASKRQRNADRLVITNLQKRLLSSVEAFARNWRCTSAASKPSASGTASSSSNCCRAASAPTASWRSSATTRCSIWRPPSSAPPCGRPSPLTLKIRSGHGSQHRIQLLLPSSASGC